jgi:hypothetical protein
MIAGIGRLGVVIDGIPAYDPRNANLGPQERRPIDATVRS